MNREAAVRKEYRKEEDRIWR